MNILYTYTVEHNLVSVFMYFGMWMLLCSIIVCPVCYIIEKKKFAVLSIIAGFIGLALLVTSPSIFQTSTQVYATFEPGYSIENFANDYELVEQKGELFILRECRYDP